MLLIKSLNQKNAFWRKRECVKELDFTALLLTQLRKYPSQLNMLKISKNLVTIISATNSNFRMKKF